MKTGGSSRGDYLKHRNTLLSERDHGTSVRSESYVEKGGKMKESSGGAEKKSRHSKV